MMMHASGKDTNAFSATLVTRLPTLSCSFHRLLVPVWIRIWPGVPNSRWERFLSASSVMVHHIFDIFMLGKSFCFEMYLPFESIRMATSVSLWEPPSVAGWWRFSNGRGGTGGLGAPLCCIFTGRWRLICGKVSGVKGLWLF